MKKIQHAEETNSSSEVKQTCHTETPNPDLANKIAELTNDLQRTRADFENFRKNVEKDRDSARKLAKFATVEKFLPLLDDLERAIRAQSSC